MSTHLPITSRLEVIRNALIMGKVNTEELAGLIPQAYDFDTTEYEDYMYSRLDRINDAVKLMEAVIMDVIKMEATSWTN